MALAEGISRIKIGKNLTDHTRAAFYVIEKFIPEAKIKIQDVEDKNGSLIIEIEGLLLKIYFLTKYIGIGLKN